MIRPVVRSEKPISTPVEELESEPLQVRLYPNPATDQLFVRLAEGDFDDFEYVIFNSVGQLLKQGVLEPNIGLNGLINGTYHVQLRNVRNNQVLRERLIILK